MSDTFNVLPIHANVMFLQTVNHVLNDLYHQPASPFLFLQNLELSDLGSRLDVTVNRYHEIVEVLEERCHDQLKAGQNNIKVVTDNEIEQLRVAKGDDVEPGVGRHSWLLRVYLYVGAVRK